jgi:hypothetical protein
MKAAPVGEIRERPTLSDPHALVARQAKRLLLMTAGAARAVLSRGRRVHGQKVVRVHEPRPHAPIVAIRARLLAVAIAAKATVVSRDALVPGEPIWTVLRVFHPLRREQLRAAQLGLELRTVAEVTRRTRTARRDRARARALMTADARAHARQLIARGKLHALDSAMTTLASRAARHVHCVIELQARRRELQARNTISVPGAITQMAETALCDELVRIRLYGRAVRVVAAMATVAASAGREQPIRAVSAGLRAVVTRRARDPELTHVPRVIEANREPLRRKHRRARSPVSG